MPGYGQSFSPGEWDKISLAILDMHSEYIKLKALKELDSATIENLTLAYSNHEAAIQQLTLANQESEKIITAQKEIITEKDSQIKKERRKTKIVAIGSVILIILLL